MEDGYRDGLKVLFFPYEDRKLLCDSLINSIGTGRPPRCWRKNCTYSHDVRSPSMEIYRTLYGATESIDVCMYLITNDRLAQFLVRLKEGKRIRLRIITDTHSNLENEGDKIEYLVSKGIELKHNPSALMHNKFVIIDDKTVMHGSFNWTNRALQENDETIVISSHGGLALEFVKQFQLMWKKLPLVE